MAKKLDLTRSVHDLVEDYPELVDTMASIGFVDIAKPMALKTVGRIMTIPKGCAIKDFDLADVVSKLQAAGFTVVNYKGESANATSEQDIPAGTPDGIEKTAVSHDVAEEHTPADSERRQELLRSYIQRLSSGEDLESVRTDFVANFQDVDPLEIMRAEQALIEGGTSVHEVQGLCDVHSALFHGCTHEEMLSDAEAAVSAAFGGTDAEPSAVRRLIAVEGHPLQIFTQENEAIAVQIKRVLTALDAGDEIAARAELDTLRQAALHYMKKGDLLYPLLATKYDVFGPSKVMWGVDDEIRDEMSLLAADSTGGEHWTERVRAVTKRADEMIFKEANILFPLCADSFSEDEWKCISRDFGQYEPCLISGVATWAEAQMPEPEKASATDGKIVLAGGTFTPAELAAMLNTVPMEITFVDAENINRFFNEGPKAFKRPGMALGREVFSCHPPKIELVVRDIIEGFRSGTNDSVDVWMNKAGDPHLVRYMAVRDASGTYLGTVECVQNMAFAQKHFSGEK